MYTTFLPSTTAGALHRGEVDAVFCDNISASYLLNHSRVSEFAVSTLNGYSYPIALGVEISSDAELLFHSEQMRTIHQAFHAQ